MGQKAHSVGLRLSVTKKWKSTWFTNFSHYSDFLHKNLNLKKFFEGILTLNPKKSILVDFKIIKHFSNKIFIFVFFYKIKNVEKINNQHKLKQKNEKTNIKIDLKKNSFIQIQNLKNKQIFFQNLKNNKNFLNYNILYRLYFLKKVISKKKNSLSNNNQLLNNDTNTLKNYNLKLINKKKLNLKKISFNYQFSNKFNKKKKILNVNKIKNLHLIKYYNNWLKKDKKKKLIFYKIRGSVDLNKYQQTKVFIKSFNKNILNLSKNFFFFTKNNNKLQSQILNDWFNSKDWSQFISLYSEKKLIKLFLNSFFFDLIEELTNNYKNFDKLLFSKNKNILPVFIKTFFIYNLDKKLNLIFFEELSNRNLTVNINKKYNLLDLILQMRLNYIGRYFLIWHYNKNNYIKNFFNVNEYFSTKKNFYYNKLNSNKIQSNELSFNKLKNNYINLKLKKQSFDNLLENNTSNNIEKRKIYMFLINLIDNKLNSITNMLNNNHKIKWINEKNNINYLIQKSLTVREKKKDIKLSVQNNFFDDVNTLKLNIYKLTKLYSNIYFINVNSLHSFTFQNFNALQEKDDLLKETRKKLQALNYVKKGLLQRWRSVNDYLPNVVNIAKISVFMKNSQFLADFISTQISILPKKYRQTFFFKFIGKILSNIKADHNEMLGFRLKFTGRFNKWTRSKKWVYSVGSLTFQSYKSYVSYACSHGLVKKGRFSTKLWYQYKDNFVDTLSGHIVDYFYYSKIKQKQC